jgi:hypothetical protein
LNGRVLIGCEAGLFCAYFIVANRERFWPEKPRSSVAPLLSVTVP